MSNARECRGVVAGGGAETVAAGVEILGAGGSAADAALAAIMVAFHAEPLLASAAGGGMMLAGDPAGGYHVLDFAPAVPGLGLAARPSLDFEPATLCFGATTQVFHVGRGAAAVPSTFFGMAEAHRRWGRLPLAEVVAPAVRICRDGLQLREGNAAPIRLLEPIWSHTPESAALFTVDGRTARSGDRLLNPAFADVLELFAEEGTAPFTRGDIAEQILQEFGPQAGGLMTAADLAAYRPEVRDPLRLAVAGGELLTPPPPTSGGTMVALIVALLARAGLTPDQRPDASHCRAVVAAQLVAETVRREVLDPPRREVAEQLLSPQGIAGLAERLGSIEPGAQPAPAPSRGATTHVSVLDSDGGVAAITVSYGEGCGHLIPGTGMQMNNFLGEADLNPRGFHLHQPSERLPTMMAPSVWVCDGRPRLVLGSGGANRLRSAIAQVVVNRIILGRSLEAAVAAPRVHVEPHRLSAELAGAAADELAAQAARFTDHSFFPEHNMYFGGVHAVAVEGDGTLLGQGDPRRGGCAAFI